jgi:hypothetical protein
MMVAGAFVFGVVVGVGIGMVAIVWILRLPL